MILTKKKNIVCLSIPHLNFGSALVQITSGSHNSLLYLIVTGIVIVTLAVSTSVPSLEFHSNIVQGCCQSGHVIHNRLFIRSY